MSAHQAFICRFCIMNINEEDPNALQADAYVASAETKYCTFCNWKAAFLLSDGSAENIRRLTKVLKNCGADFFYEDTLFN